MYSHEFDTEFREDISFSGLTHTEKFHLGTYTPELFKSVMAGSVIMGHCDGGYNELLVHYDHLPDKLKLRDKSDGELVLIDLTNWCYYQFESCEELIKFTGEAFDHESEEWTSVENWLSKYRDQLPC